jgi:hypothetical protein
MRIHSSMRLICELYRNSRVVGQPEVIPEAGFQEVGIPFKFY